MSPNLFLATQKLFSPHKWFRDNKLQERSIRKTEHWSEPTPGLYEYIPGRGWYLIAEETSPTQPATTSEGGPVQAAPEPSYERLAVPIFVHWSRVLKRYMLEPTYKDRKKHGIIQNAKGKNIEVGFFRLDNGVAWVQCWDQHGTFIPGPYKLWCISQRTGLFRPMLRGDDPNFAGSRNASRSGSRNPSFEGQESKSLFYGPSSSRAASNRDGSSVPSTRPSSLRQVTGQGPPSSEDRSQPVSRPASIKRNGSAEVYEKDKAAMRQMARDHREALVKAATAAARVDSKTGVERIEHGAAADETAGAKEEAVGA
ncbi:hypothetical protein E8E13_002392 [Curvularia kusanoi]|uniref:Uncharacterized protein n=1 Tax=Curvularia kusanoi TaxID=90978 RepID=A0A9P4W756_CURKU|nr:hypothetical protein E8E13_002392 [Curvularia kusanoi]